MTKATFGGLCGLCEKRWAAGDVIERDPEAKWVHLACFQKKHAEWKKLVEKVGRRIGPQRDAKGPYFMPRLPGKPAMRSSGYGKIMPKGALHHRQSYDSKILGRLKGLRQDMDLELAKHMESLIPQGGVAELLRQREEERARWAEKNSRGKSE